jgi:hypothetical protein
LVLSFNTRLELVIELHGRSISQSLSSHRKERTADHASANPDFRRFGGEEDAVIQDSVKCLGNGWKKIAEILEPRFGQRDGCQIGHRTKFQTERIANDHVGRQQLPILDQPAAAETDQKEGAPFNRNEFFQTTGEDRDKDRSFVLLERSPNLISNIEYN